jgi:hypothetical protein
VLSQGCCPGGLTCLPAALPLMPPQSHPCSTWACLFVLVGAGGRREGGGHTCRHTQERLSGSDTGVPESSLPILHVAGRQEVVSVAQVTEVMPTQLWLHPSFRPPGHLLHPPLPHLSAALREVTPYP